MGWIGDVIPRTTIRSTWGNGVRNQLVQTFDFPGQWDQVPVQDEGMFGWSKADNRFVYRDENGWHFLEASLAPIPEWRAGIYTATFVVDFPNGGLQASIPFSTPMTQTPVVVWQNFNTVVPNGYTVSTSPSGFVIKGDSPPLNVGHQRTVQYVAVLAR